MYTSPQWVLINKKIKIMVSDAANYDSSDCRAYQVSKKKYNQLMFDCNRIFTTYIYVVLGYWMSMIVDYLEDLLVYTDR